MKRFIALAALLAAAPANAKPTVADVYVAAGEAFFCELVSQRLTREEQISAIRKLLPKVQKKMLSIQNYSKQEIDEFVKTADPKKLTEYRDYGLGPNCPKHLAKFVELGGKLPIFKSNKPRKNLNDQGRDIFGMPKIAGYAYRPSGSSQSVFYWKLDEQGRARHKIKVRGLYGRYVALSGINRYYQQPFGGIAPSTTTIGSAQTNCYGAYNSVSCTTTPAPTITNPGIAPRAGGVMQRTSVVVYDCVDKTSAEYVNNHILGRWKKTGSPKLWAKVCSNIHGLTALDFDKLAGGEPNAKDRQAARRS